MFDAAAAATAATVADHTAAQNASADTHTDTSLLDTVAKVTAPATDSHDAAAPAAAAAKEVVFIDSAVPNLQTLLNGVKPGDQVFVLDPNKDGVQQIADILAANNLTGLSAIQIVGHGGQGNIQLGTTVLDDTGLTAEAPALAQIGAALAPGGDIALYSCDTAAGASGMQFITDLSAYAGGIDVEASTHNIGSADLGGDWSLDSATGTIQDGAPFTAQALAQYEGDLSAQTPINNDQPSLALTQTIVMEGIYPTPGGSSSDNPDGIPIASIRTFASNTAPNGTFLANGEPLPISQYAAQFSLVGTSYGGNGQTAFQLPNLMDATIIGAGQGTGLSDYVEGQNVGTDSVTLLPSQMPSSIGGGGVGFDNHAPSLTLNYLINTGGPFPTIAGESVNFLGAIIPFAGNFAPDGYMFAAGQTLAIAQNTALFSLLGTTYGGNGTTTFQLPDLQGRVAVGASATHPLGSEFGSENTSITTGNLPFGAGGSDSAVNNDAPSLAVNFLVATAGIFNGINIDEPALGEVIAFAGTANEMPAGWHLADGTLLPIAQDTALFNLLGTTYGGDGQTTFALPNLQNRDIVSVGTNFSGTQTLGEQSGSDTISLVSSNVIDALPTFQNVDTPVGSVDQNLDILEHTITVNDANLTLLGNYSNSSLTIVRHGGANADDDFGFDTNGALFTVSGGNLQVGGNTFATFTDAGGTLTVNFLQSGAVPTKALVNDVLQHVTYADQNATPPTSLTLDLTFSDGNTNAQGAVHTPGTVTDSIVVNFIPGFTSGATANVNEGIATGSTIYTAAATDPFGEALTYTLGGADASLLTINATSGAVTINSSPDFETKSSYSFNVKATDTSLQTATKAVTLSINDLAPVISSGATANVNEGVAANTAIYTAVAADPGGGAVTYSLAGVDATAFAINAATGLVTINATPDFETKATYNFNVKASDSSGSFNTRAVTLTVNNLAPVISSGSTATINEGVAPGSTVYTAAAADPGGGAVTYSLAGADAAAFTINSATGVVTINGVPDFETKNSYSFNVKASDSSNLFNTQAVTINVTDLPPVISSGNTASVAEGVPASTVVYTAVATDPASGTVTYALTGTDAAAFTINSSTGVVTINAIPDFETKASYSFNVKASDSTGQFNLQAVTLNIADLPPVISSGATANVNEGVAANTAIYTAGAADPAGGAVTYSITGTDASAFTINSSTGVVTINASPNFAVKNSYSFTAKARDASGQFSTQNVTLTVNDVNFPPSGANNAIAGTEDTPYVFSSSDFGFSDPNDSPPNALLAVEITTLPGAGSLTDNGTAVTAGQFVSAADVGGGLLVFTPAPNANGAGYASFTFQLQDNGGTANGGVDLDPTPNTITFNIAAVNDAPVVDTPVDVTTLVSTDVNGVEGDGDSLDQQQGVTPVFSPDGTMVAFVSDSDNLVPGGTLGGIDIFVKNLATGVVTLVSADANGVEADGPSAHPVFSPDSTKILFSSFADNLVPGGTTTGISNVYIKDLVTGAVTLVSTDSSSGQGDDGSYDAVFSPDGTKVAFDSDADNLVVGDTNGTADVFIKDLASGTLTLVSTDASGNQGDDGSFYPTFSPDGTKIAFDSYADNLIGAGNDTNNASDVFLKDLTTGAVTLVSTDSSGNQGDDDTADFSFYAPPVFSPDGTKILFESYADNLVPNDNNGANDIFLKDLVTGATTRVSTGTGGSEGDGDSHEASFSPDGTEVLFASDSDNLVPLSGFPFAPGVYLKDLTTDTTVRLSHAPDGTPEDFGSAEPSFSPDGKSIVFDSGSDNLVAGDNNFAFDVFIVTPATTIQTFIEQGAAVTVASHLTVSDVDSANLVGATATISSGFLAGDVLGFVNQNGITGSYNAGTHVLTLTGSASVADYQAALRSVTFSAAGDNPTDFDTDFTRTITWQVNDGSGANNLSTSADSPVNMQGIDDPPVNSVPGGQTVNEDTGLIFNAHNGNAISISDVDAGTADMTVVLSVQNGILTVPDNVAGGLTTGDITDNGTDTVILIGSQDAINATLAAAALNNVGLTYTPDANFNGSDTLTVLTDDNGNTGFPGFFPPGTTQDQDSIAITINAVNDAPVATTPAAHYGAVEQTSLDLKNSGLSISDVDAGASGSMTVTLSVSEGVLTVDPGTSGAAVSNSGTASVTILGTVDAINALLNTDAISAVSYIDSSDNPAASATLTLAVNDNGNTGAGGPLSASATATIDIAAVNDAPTVSAPATVAAQFNTDTAIFGISFADADSNGGSETVTLHTGSGALLSAVNGGNVTVAGSGSDTLTLNGTIADLNSFIDNDQVTINASASDTIDVIINDGGHTGSGGALSSATAQISAQIDVPPTAPVDNDANTNTVPEGSANGTLVGITAFSTDPDSPSVTYSLYSDSSNGGFAIDPTTGVVTVADSSKIDYESSGGSDAISVLASDGIGGRRQTFAIAVTDVAPSTPVDADATANNVVEGAANGTAVGVTASSSDPNGPAVTYSLTGDTSGGGFTIDTTTGVVTVADASKLDYESAAGHAYTVTVQASGGALTSSQAFTIAVTDVAPSTPVDANGSTNTVVEGAATGTVVGITASASDVNGPAVSYSLSADSSGGGFAINSTTGVVTVADASKIDYESAAGHAYTVTAQASDGTLTSSQTFTIAVTDVAPSTPVDANAAANTVAEGAAVGTTVGVTASSSDINGPAVTYSLTGDTSGGGFTIDAATGVVTVADSSKLDYESAAGHAYTITAQASDGTLTSSQTFTIAVTDVAPSTPVDGDAAANSVAEGAANGTVVGVTASSSDPNGPAVTYSLTGDTSGGGFAINSTTGVVTVADASKIDFESSGGNYAVTVQGSDGTLTSSQTFAIAVTDVAPSTPVDVNGSANTVVEGAATGTVVGITASASDVNGPAVSYSLSADSSGGGFTINSTTGVVTVADASKIDYESAAGHAYTITAQASDGTLTSSQTFTIAVTDVAPSTPVDANATANTVAEGAAVGTTVGVTASSSDINGPAVTYSLTGDTSGGGFTIDAATGVVTVADPSKLDYESAAGHAYTITAQASDGTLTSSQTFTIAVTDVAPSTPVDSDAATNTVAEGAAAGTTVGVTASSSDINGPAVTYSLTGDTSGGGFTIDATTGMVTVADPSKLDYESAAGHAYTVTVQASGGALTSSQAFTIAVTDVAPSTPVDANGSTNTVAEGAAAGTTVGVTASSSDINGPAVTYSLTGDTSGGGFTINSTTGVVTVVDASKIDYESAAGHAYTVTAQASDGTLTSSQTFTIAVTDVAPSTPVDANAAANSVAEGAAVGTTVGVTASSSDINGPAVTYSLTGDTSGGGFTINSTTGVVTVADPSKLDYESAAGHAYTITAQASDGTLTSSQTFTIAVTDVAPSTPVDGDAAANSVAEGAANGTVVGVTASSSDPNGPAVTYSLTGDTSGGGFAINSTTGVVTVADASKIDFESSGGNYAVTVQGSDGTLTSSQTFAIAVTDVAPSTPVDVNGSANTVVEGAANGTLVGITASASDINGPAVTYSLTGDTSGGGFTIDPTTGVVTVADTSRIDYESAAGQAYTVTAQASDGTLTSSQTFTIAVTDVAPSTPVDANVAANTVAEGAAVGTIVGVTASSSDINGPAVTYSLTGDTSGGGFTIDAATGVVTVADSSKLDYESAAGHAYTITAQASDGTLTTTQTFTIAVTDVAPTTPVDANAAANSVVEGAANGTAVGITASASDVNGPAVTYSLSADSSGGGFAINSTTGVVTVADASKIDFESSGGSYAVTVQASDGTLNSSQIFAIAVTDVAPSVPVDVNAAANTVVEGAATGTVVGITASANDVNGPAVSYSLSADSSGGGFAINPNTGVVTVADASKIDYESAAGHAYTVTAQASDGTLTGSQTFTIAVTDVAPSTPVDADVVANSVAEGAANGTAVGVTASSADINGGSVTYSLTDSAGGRFAINASSGVVTVADSTLLDFETATSNNIIVKAADPSGASTTQTFTIAVTDVAPTTPVDANAAANSVVEGGANGTAVGITASASDVNGPAVTYSLSADSSGGGFTINSTTGVVTVADASKIDYESAAGHAYTITAQASDGTLTSSQTFTIAVTDVAPSTPVDANAAANTVAEGAAAGTATGLTASSSDVNGGTITYALTADTSNGGFAVNAATGAVTVTDASKIDFESASGHAYAVTVRASDGTLSSSQNFTIAVSNVAPVAAADSASVNEDGVLTVGAATGVLANDGDVNGGALTATLVSGPSHGALTLNANGSFSYTPVANYNGSDSFTYKANDGTADSNIVTVALTVVSVNDAPLGANKTITTLEDTPYVFTAADFGFSDPSDAGSNSGANALAAVRIGTLPGAGSLTDNGVAVSVGQLVSVADITAGKLVFAPAPDANGTGYAAFTFQVQDNGGTANGGVALAVSPSTITLNVTPVNDAPVPTSASVSLTDSRAGDTYSFQLPTGLFSDVDGDTLTLSTQNLPVGLSFDPTTRTISGVPSSVAVGTDSFTLTATDPSGAAAHRTLTLVVQPVLVVLNTDNPPPPDTGTGGTGGTGTDGGTDNTGGTADGAGNIGNAGAPIVFVDNSTPVGPGLGDYVTIDTTATGATGAGSYFVLAGDVSHTGSFTTGANGAFSFILPQGTFTTNDGGVTVDAFSADGTELPGWLRFDAATGTFTVVGGVPSNAQDVSVEVVAHTRDGRIITVKFTLSLKATHASAAPLLHFADVGAPRGGASAIRHFAKPPVSRLIKAASVDAHRAHRNTLLADVAALVAIPPAANMPRAPKSTGKTVAGRRPH